MAHIKLQCSYITGFLRSLYFVALPAGIVYYQTNRNSLRDRYIG